MATNLEGSYIVIDIEKTEVGSLLTHVATGLEYRVVGKTKRTLQMIRTLVVVNPSEWLAHTAIPDVESQERTSSG